MKKKSRGGWLAAPMGLWSAAFVGVSLLYIIGLSLLKSNGAMGTTGELTLENYQRMLAPSYLQVLVKSLEMALATTLMCLVIGYPFGYLMARAKKRVRNLLMMLIIVPFWTNALIRIYGWKILLAANGPINAALMALGIIQEPLKMLYTDGAVLVGMVYALIPFMILPAFTSVDKMDWSVVEASRDLGAKRWQAFLTVTFPLTLSGVMSGCVLVFIPSIGLFFLSDLLGGSKNVLAGNLINTAMTKSRDLPFAAALSVVLLAVTGAIIALQRRAGGSSGDMNIF